MDVQVRVWFLAMETESKGANVAPRACASVRKEETSV